jgi:hypothetical protein
MLLTKLKTSEGMLAVPCPYEMEEEDASSAEAADFRIEAEGFLGLAAALEPATAAPPPRGADRVDAMEKAEASAVTRAKIRRSMTTAARRRNALNRNMILTDLASLRRSEVSRTARIPSREAAQKAVKGSSAERRNPR